MYTIGTHAQLKVIQEENDLRAESGGAEEKALKRQTGFHRMKTRTRKRPPPRMMGKEKRILEVKLKRYSTGQKKIPTTPP